MVKPPHNSVGITTLICVALLAVSSAEKHYPRNIQEVKNSATYDESKSFNIAEASQYSGSFSASSGSSKSVLETIGNSFSDAQKLTPIAVHATTQVGGCANPGGCAGITLEDGKITKQFGDQSILEGAPLDEQTGGREFHASQLVNVANGEIPNSGPFWWMKPDSPFRNAYQAYLKFKSTGVAELPSVCTATGCTFSGPDSATAPSVHIEGTPADIKNNPYINGQFEALAEQYLKSQANSQGGSVKIDISQNPFLNGQISSDATAQRETFQSVGGGFAATAGATATGSAATGSGSTSSESANVEDRFEGNQASGSIISGETGSGVFVTGLEGEQQGSSSSSSSSSGSVEINGETQTGFGGQEGGGQLTGLGAQGGQSSFEVNTQLGGGEVNAGGDELFATCTGRNRVCVLRNQCVNGVVAAGVIQTRSGNQKCRTSIEVCCKLGKRSTGSSSGTKTGSGNGIGVINVEDELQTPSLGDALPNRFGSTNAIDSTYFSQSDSFRPGQEPGQKPGIPYLPPDTEGSILLDETRTKPPKTRPSSKRPYNPVKTKPASTPKPYYPPYIPPVVTSPPYIAPTVTSTPYIPPITNPPYIPQIVTSRPYIPSVVTSRPYIPPIVTNPPYIPPIVTNPPYIPPKVTRPPYVPPTFTNPPYIPPQTTPAPYIPPPTRRPTYSTYRPIFSKAPEYLPPRDNVIPTTTKAPHYKTGSLYLDQTRTTPGITPTASLGGCAAALLCTPEDFCTADGVISNTSVYLSDYQKTFRVPITDCVIPSSGLPGKCCRDPYYTDPWPTNQLGLWIPEAFGDTGAYTPNGPVKSKPRPRPTVTTPLPPLAFTPTYTPTFVPAEGGGLVIGGGRRPFITTTSTPFLGSGSNTYETNFLTGNLLLSQFQDGQFGYAYGQCGLRRPGVPQGNHAKLEVDFAEIPWQAMILLKTNKSLLCGGVITRPEVVATTASCVEGLRAGEVQVKGGEWKLGVEEEPLPFQILTVKQIIKHPGYQSGGLANDVALLILESAFVPAANVYPICLPSENESIEELYQGSSNCVTTGWGKKVLQGHIPNQLMHAVSLDLLNEGECRQKLQNYPSLLRSYDRKSCLCGQTKNINDNICKVDTGSALACDNGNGHWVLRGIFSFDTGCDNIENQFAGFYKFDVEWFWHVLGLRVSTKYTISQTLPSYFTDQDTGLIPNQEFSRLPGFIKTTIGPRPGVTFLQGSTVTPLPTTIYQRPIRPDFGNQGLGIIRVPGDQQEQGLINVRFQGSQPGLIQGPAVTTPRPIFVPEVSTFGPTVVTYPSPRPTFIQGQTALTVPNGFVQGQEQVSFTGVTPGSIRPQVPLIQGQDQFTFTGINQGLRPSTITFGPGPQTPRPLTPIPQIPRPTTPRPTFIQNPVTTFGFGTGQGSIVSQNQGQGSGIIQGNFGLPGVNTLSGTFNVPSVLPNVISSVAPTIVPNIVTSFRPSIGPTVGPTIFPSTVTPFPNTDLEQGNGIYTSQGITRIPFIQNQGVNFGQRINSLQGQGAIKGSFENTFNQPRPTFGPTIIKGVSSGTNLINQQDIIKNYGQGSLGTQGGGILQGQGIIRGPTQGFSQTGGFTNFQTQGSLNEGGVVKQYGTGFLPSTVLTTGPTIIQGGLGGQNGGKVQGQYEYKQTFGPVVGGYQFHQEEVIPQTGIEYQYESKKILPTVTRVIPGQRVQYQYKTENLIPQMFGMGGNFQINAERTVVPQVTGGHYKVSYQSDLSQQKPQINVQYQAKEFGKPPTSGSYVINGLGNGPLPTSAVSQFGLKDAFAVNNQAQASDYNCECLDDYA